MSPSINTTERTFDWYVRKKARTLEDQNVSRFGSSERMQTVSYLLDFSPSSPHQRPFHPPSPRTDVIPARSFPETTRVELSLTMRLDLLHRHDLDTVISPRVRDNTNSTTRTSCQRPHWHLSNIDILCALDALYCRSSCADQSADSGHNIVVWKEVLSRPEREPTHQWLLLDVRCRYDHVTREQEWPMICFQDLKILQIHF